MKTRVTTALAIALLGSLAAPQVHAQEGSLPVQQFAPAPGGDNNFVTVQGTQVLPSFKPAAGLYLNYAHDPLVLRRLANDEQVSLVEHHLQLDLIAAIGFFDFLELGISVPLTLYQTQGAQNAAVGVPPRDIEAFTTGDIRLYPKVSILHDPEGFGLSFLALVSLPTGSPENLQGNESVTIEPRFAAEYSLTETFRIGASLGFLWRPEEQALFNIDLGNELTFGAAIEYEIAKDEVAIIAEGYGKIALSSDTQGEERPIEVALAGRWWPGPAHALTLGIARGLTDGYGSPDFRVFLGYNYTTQRDDDRDGDGLKDSLDRCPDDPEDFDSFEDEDGCPDVDNDKDGILDVNDDCPMQPEDKDGFEDQDGCPDIDNDKDGVLDINDGAVDGSGFGICRDNPEDMDGFEDEDGCPDPDNDKDGVPDVKDGPPLGNGFGGCMNAPEDVDNFEDADGCPDPDNDGDGILDLEDKCPNDSKNLPGCDGVIVNPCGIQILDKVHFKYDKWDIDLQKSKPLLDAVASALNSNPQLELIEVQGHTDSDGDAPYNERLSQKRSESVIAFLVKAGVAPSRLTPKGYGESRPIDTNANPAGREKNRRVQFVILKPVQENCTQDGLQGPGGGDLK